MTDDFSNATPRPWTFARPHMGFSEIRGPHGELVFGIAAGSENEKQPDHVCDDNAGIIIAAVNAYRAEPSDEDVERVARVIEPELFKPIPSGVMWNPLARRMAKRAARDKARAAIDALRAKP